MSTPNPSTTPWVPLWSLNGGTPLNYKGAYAPGNYSDGDIVVQNGVAYVCVRPTANAPAVWPVPFGTGLSGGSTINASGATVDIPWSLGTVMGYFALTPGGGAIRSIGDPGAAGARLTLKNTSTGYIILRHALAGGTGKMLSIIGAGDKILPPGSSNEFLYDGTNWIEINRPATELICSLTLGASQASFDTNTILGGNIPAVYNHLRVMLDARSDVVASNTSFNVRVNNDSGTNYFDVMSQVVATTPIGAETFSATSMSDLAAIMAASAVAGYSTGIVIDIPRYAAATFTKNFLALSGGLWNGGSGLHYVRMAQGVWGGGTAINRLTLYTPGNFVTGSSFMLYGVT